MFTRRTISPEERIRCRNASFKENVSAVSPARPAMKLRPGKSSGIPSLRFAPTSLTISTARKTASASPFRLFAATTSGSADSIPNAAISPAVCPATIAASASRAASSCRAMVPGLTLSMCSVRSDGAADRISVNRFLSASGLGVGNSPPPNDPNARRSG